MRRRSLAGSALTALGLLAGCGAASAQIEMREAETRATSAEMLFRSTLFGAGTGLAASGAYALLSDEVEIDRTLLWGTAGGAAGGMLVGLIYVLIQSGEGDSGMIQWDDDGLRLSLMGALPEKRHDLAGVRGRSYDVSLFSIGM